MLTEPYAKPRQIPIKVAELRGVYWKHGEMFASFFSFDKGDYHPLKDYSASVLFRLAGTGPTMYWVYGKVVQCILAVDRKKFNAKILELAEQWNADHPLEGANGQEGSAIL